VAFGLVGACLALFFATLAPFLYLWARAPKELAILRLDKAQALRLTQLHKFPLIEAAMESGRATLEHVLTLQTQIAVFAFGLIGVYYLWRGYANPRPRGWSHFFWLTGVALFFFAPTAAPRLTPQRIDFGVEAIFSAPRAERREPYALKPLSDPAAAIQPSAALFARALFASAFAAFLALSCHDAAYRLREALVEFGLIVEEPGRREPQDGGPGASAGRGGARAGADAQGREHAAEADGGFGQRGRGRVRRPRDDPRARAYALLGLAEGAGKAEIERAYRAKMKRAHPDHGGSVELAAALNQARDALLPHV